ncbi:hypothetical protein [Pseudoalteromonas piscicida]|uniref:Uncharacterized protein n=1 Tax=Pseudoalteromonas piscicida TaxID=43662 RepID=A0AAD0W690_PSEO7|nr:hypothetical protein [Pseudoalteromonas piscicida]AXR04432.1 hypothetical protein D0511_21215 [Pseudoalteromonas piscicida]
MVREYFAKSFGRDEFKWSRIPDFLTPYYIEFEEILGGHNFAGGIGMLDLVNREFDWGCG